MPARAWRGDRAAECGGLENRCTPGVPGVRIPPSPRFAHRGLRPVSCPGPRIAWALETSHSGLVRLPAKEVGVEAPREFESPHLRSIQASASGAGGGLGMPAELCAPGAGPLLLAGAGCPIAQAEQALVGSPSSPRLRVVGGAVASRLFRRSLVPAVSGRHGGSIPVVPGAPQCVQYSCLARCRPCGGAASPAPCFGGWLCGECVLLMAR